MKFRTLKILVLGAGAGFAAYKIMSNEQTRELAIQGFNKLQATALDNIKRVKYLQTQQVRDLDSLQAYQESICEQWNRI